MDEQKLYGVEETHNGRLHWVNKNSRRQFEDVCEAICVLEGYEMEPDSMDWVETLRDASHGKYIIVDENVFRLYDEENDTKIAGQCILIEEDLGTFKYSATFNDSVTMLELVLEEALREKIKRREELPW